MTDQSVADRRGGRAPHVLLVAPAGSYRVADHLDAAARLGCELTVITDAAVAIAGSAIVADLDDVERAATVALAACGRPVDAAIGTEGAAVRVAAEIARRCDLPCNAAEALEKAADKASQRRVLAEAGVPQPEFAVAGPTATPTPHEADADATAGPTATRAPASGREIASTHDRLAGLLPAVVKPPDRTASQGVLRADTPAQLRQATARVRALVGPTSPVLVERFVPGTEIAVDGVLRDGRLHVLAVFDKPDTPSGPTFPETLLISPARLADDVRRSVIDVVRRATRAVGLTEGPVHAECKVDGGDIWFLELAARTIGGLCSRSLRVAGLTVEELVLRHALRLPVPSAVAEDATGVLMLPATATGRLVAVRGIERARAVPAISGVVVTTPPGAKVVPLPEGDRYLGFVFARAASADACERALRRAWAELTVVVDPELDDEVPDRASAADQRLVGG